jgi:hypothetical protein
MRVQCDTNGRDGHATVQAAKTKKKMLKIGELWATIDKNHIKAHRSFAICFQSAVRSIRNAISADDRLNTRLLPSC